MTQCIFCKIMSKEIPAHVIYEDEEFIAILDLFPNRQGQTLVIPKKHYDSYAFDMPDDDYCKLLLTAKKVGKLLDRKLGALRTAMVMEGLGVDHVHIKLYPMKRGIIEGALSTALGPKADDNKLRELAQKIRAPVV